MTIDRSPEKAKKDHEELRGQIDHHDHQYYGLNSPEIGDGQYDELMKQLRELEADFPELIDENSPTQRVAGKVSESFESVTHQEPLLSLYHSCPLMCGEFLPKLCGKEWTVFEA